MFAELVCQSHFSFLFGASSPDDLVERAVSLEYQALAITDECSLAGVVRAHVAAKAAKESNLKLIIGSLLRCEDGLTLVLLAQNREGYARLSALITQARMRSEKGSYRLLRDDFAQGVDDCLCLWLPNETAPVANQQHNDGETLRWLKVRFNDRLAIACTHTLTQASRAWHVHLHALSRAHDVPCVATNAALMHTREAKPLADIVTAIRLNQTVAECGYELLPNGERHLRPLSTLQRLFPQEWIDNGIAFANRCTFSLDSLRYEYPQELVPDGETPSSHLRALTMQGMARRYPSSDVESLEMHRARKKCLAIIEHELKLIAEMQFEAFFLTVHDIVVFARSRNILCQGRGSAANSAVCYCLGITEVDPGRMEVLFERFISKERNEPPDIDVDFEHHRREEVIQYIYQKYGRHRAALAATVICYRRRSAIRDVGKALGFEATQIDALSRSIAWWDRASELEERFREVGLDPSSAVVQQYAALVQALLGFPRHLSQHVGGFVIARDQLSRLVPVENAAMPDRSVIQWDKDDLESLGLLKVDVLALGMLSAIRLTLDHLNQYHGTSMTMADVPKEDAATYGMICRADTVGVFQIESRAQMSMLPRLKPSRFYDLVIEVAIVRPGPIQGGMVHPYLRRKQGLEPITYPSAAIEKVLERTLGVSIFQEQVMKIAEVAAGFTRGEADLLRRAMAAWKRKGGLEPFRDKLIAGMTARGYETSYAESLYKQIQGFGEYGFPESHAASFALLAYVSAWLKCHHPAAFVCGLLNAWPMGFYTPSQLIQDVLRHGVEVRPVDVLTSAFACTLERANDGSPSLRLGFKLVKGLPHEAAERIVAARKDNTFTDIASVARLAALNARDLAALTSADAFHRLSTHRRDAHWQALAIGKRPAKGMFAGRDHDGIASELAAPSEGENIITDYAHLGFSLRSHPLALLRQFLRRHITAVGLEDLPSGAYVRVSGLVTCRQRPGTASGVVFVTLEDETGNINVVVWAHLVERQRKELLGASLMTVHGRVEKESGVTHLIADKLENNSHLLGRLAVESRDFH
jgi:error-prone DNA polymerase